ncbi:MAG: hypothetical protein ACRC24_04735 [Vibrionaceae bacterium]
MQQRLRGYSPFKGRERYHYLGIQTVSKKQREAKAARRFHTTENCAQFDRMADHKKIGVAST